MTHDGAPELLRDRHVIAVFHRSVGDVEDRWWHESHVPRLREIPNLLRVQRFAIADTKPLPGTNPLDYGHACVYEVDGSVEEPCRALNDLWHDTPPPGLDALTVMAFHPVSRVHLAPRFDPITSFKDRHLLLVWVNRPDEESEATTFDNWYDDTHIRDFLSAPGVFRAQRFLPEAADMFVAATEVQRGHLAMYEVDGDLLPVREEIKTQLMSGQMVLPHFVPPPFDSMFLRPTSEYTSAFSQEAVAK